MIHPNKAALVEPPAGSPPTLEWIAVDRLSIDESYQRATDSSRSRGLIAAIALRWNWSLCQPLVVSRRLDGSLFVIDGQHRLSGALARGDIPHLPCVILSAQDGIDEARTFIELNTKRQRLSQGDVFNAMLAAGDEAAKETAKILDETGWKITRNNSLNVAGRINSAPMVSRAVKLEGATVVRNALTALREAYPDRPVPNAATLLKALFFVFRKQEAPEDADLFISILGSVEPGDWEEFGRDARRSDASLSRIEGIETAMVTAYRDALSDAKTGLAA